MMPKGKDIEESRQAFAAINRKHKEAARLAQASGKPISGFDVIEAIRKDWASHCGVSFVSRAKESRPVPQVQAKEDVVIPKRGRPSEGM